MFYRAKVENNKDPLGIQRIQVRINGVHSLDETLLPSEILPWAEASLPLTMGRVDGGFGEYDVPDEGDWVWVFFEEVDSRRKRPYYFGIIRGHGDSNNNYNQGDNKHIRDRWENKTTIDKDHFEHIDTWNNKTLINKDKEEYADHFGNKITMNEDKIEILSQNGNKILMNSKEDIIVIKTPKNGDIQIKDDKNIEINISGYYIDLGEDGNVSIGTKDGKNETFDFYKTMMLFNTHTHNLGYVPTTPPLNFMTMFDHAYEACSYYGARPVNNMLITEDNKDYIGDDDVPGTIYTNEKSIHPDTQKPDNDDNEVSSTKLMNKTTNPSTDEFEGAMILRSIPPLYTDIPIQENVEYYSGGKIIKKGELVLIQGKAVDREMAKKIYEMIKKSQIYNMVHNLKLLEKEGSGYKITKKGEDADLGNEGDPFIFTDDYQNNECPYSLVIVNSGFRAHIDPILDKNGNIVARSQYQIRQRFRSKARMTHEELMTASAKAFSPYVAKPGYSKHQNGKAVDFNTRGQGGKQGEWLEKNAKDYGFKRTIPSEPWHYEYG